MGMAAAGQSPACRYHEASVRIGTTRFVGIYKHAVMSRSSKRMTGLLYVDVKDGIPRALIDVARSRQFNICVMPVGESDRETRQKQALVQGRAVLVTDKPPAAWAHIHRAGFGVIRVQPSSAPGGGEYGDDGGATAAADDASGVAADTVASGGMRVRRVDSCADITPKLLTDTAVEGLAIFLAFVAIPKDRWFGSLR